ncbi:hypothetical protein FF36_03776 [Frankia torreyi]|uniref:Uncharacterized protein n=1 Tax=Frankia torreyi TaxID=1856 RepID=A0A0D8BC75_9ACTN|nr:MULTISPECIES: hypothetical protein [Frankia]KJE21873.1 hypothetical protein FF36_03776 [Frankia torreyi]KQC35864.1 hypothetical protein UK82_24225 [Frankia sp. ACN1ag]KQM05250.1 hypothetical protein FF86_101718 [Frankia sp. CpI1-P]
MGRTEGRSASVAATRQLASGPRETPGRLVASSRKLRFLGRTGGGRYRVDDPEYVAAVLSGALRKRAQDKGARI